MASSVTLLGHAVERSEDPPLLTGSARFVADLDRPGMLHAVFVRSQVAHGLLRSVEVAEAAAMPGVVAVFTASDLPLADLPEWPRGEPPRAELGRPCLARERVRFVGEAVAVVVGSTLSAAVDAAEAVTVDIEPLPTVLDPLDALAERAPLLFPEHGSNEVLRQLTGAAGALDGSEVVVRGHFYNQRVAPCPLEPNGAAAWPAAGGRLDCFASTQAPFRLRAAIALALGRPEETVRVVAPAVGGGFGAKGGVYPEQLVTAALAERLGQPVRFVETRSENMLAMCHGRGQVQEVALGARRDGTIVGLEATMVTEMGAYCWRGPVPFSTSRIMATGPYRIPKLSLTSIGAVTNTTPIGPYRGAGRPEATAMLERMIELLAAELDLDSVEVRRRNLLAPSEFPYAAPSGASYDSGDYSAALAKALALLGYEQVRAEQADRRQSSCATELGVGIATFVEISGSGSEYGAVRVEPGGSVVVLTGSSPHGQGLATTLTQIAAGMLKVPISTVSVVHSDTALVPRGVGTFGSRSGQLAGNAVAHAVEEVLEKARELAAVELEADPDDVVQLEDGSFAVAGVPSISLGLAELARRAGGPIGAEWDFAQESGTYPFGTHIAVVEVDTETGKVELRRLVAVDDCGRVVNPKIVAGQVHGGVAQGIAQALFEAVRYDESGNPLTTNLADYAFPSAAEMPAFELGETETPSPRNPLGMKGIGESGAVGAAAAVQNAVVDALSPYGVLHLDMPADPERVWRAVHEGRRDGQDPFSSSS